MRKIITYKGICKGIKGLWCGVKPKGLKNAEEIVVFYPEEGKVFQKDGKEFKAVVLKDGEKIEDYKEVERK